MFDKNYIHLVFRRALKQDEYFRIYLFYGKEPKI